MDDNNVHYQMAELGKVDALESNREKTGPIAYFTVREILLIPEEAKAKVRKFMSMEE